MTTALALLGYAVCAAWCVPAVLAWLTRRGVSVRAGLAAWLAAMASVLAAAAVSLQISCITVAADWPTLTQAVCRSVAGSACTPAVYRNALYEAGVTVLAGAGLVIAIVAVWRFARRLERARSQTAAHATAARMVGRDLALFTKSAAAPRLMSANTGLGNTGLPNTVLANTVPANTRAVNTVVLDDPHPAAYCVAGRPAAIVLTTGTLDLLDGDQLTAVLAHEHAHLARRHHGLKSIAAGLAAAFPGVPVFTRGAAEVGCLTEMAADDAAARAAGRPALIAALLAIATGAPVPGPGPVPAPVPAPGLAAAAVAVPVRVERLLRPSCPAVVAAVAAALTLIVVALALIPLALTR